MDSISQTKNTFNYVPIKSICQFCFFSSNRQHCKVANSNFDGFSKYSAGSTAVIPCFEYLLTAGGRMNCSRSTLGQSERNGSQHVGSKHFTIWKEIFYYYHAWCICLDTHFWSGYGGIYSNPSQTALQWTRWPSMMVFHQNSDKITAAWKNFVSLNHYLSFYQHYLDGRQKMWKNKSWEIMKERCHPTFHWVERWQPSINKCIQNQKFEQVNYSA